MKGTGSRANDDIENKYQTCYNCLERGEAAL